MTGNPQSSLAVEADVHLDAAVAQEACPLNLAPTASTTAALALGRRTGGGAARLAWLRRGGFRPFASRRLARAPPADARARRHARGPAMPEVSPATSLHDAILEITRGGIGMTAVVDPQRRVIGIVTDGDLRRAFAHAASTCAHCRRPTSWGAAALDRSRAAGR
jgi:arabinose-5-phosphate isomerase